MNSIGPFLIAAITVGIIAIVNLIMKNKMKLWQYFIIFLILLGFGFLSRANASIYDFPCRLSAELEKQAYGHPVQRKMTDAERKQFAEKAIFHRAEGDRTWKDAEKMCWYFPSKSDRERALDCFKAAAAGMVPADPRAKFVTMLVTLLTQYGIDCMDSWNAISNKLYWSEYHYEMYEFYNQLATTGKY